MPAPLRKDPLIRAGRDAAIDAYLGTRTPVRCPYRSGTKLALFWNYGAERAVAALDALMRIGS